MNITFGAPASADAAGGFKLALPSFGFGLGSTSASATDRQVVLALGAAAATAHLEGAVQVLFEAKEAPPAVIAGVNMNVVGPVLQKLAAAQQAGGKVVTGDAAITAVARAIGADTQLAAVAYEQLKGHANESLRCAYWVATVDSDVLARATAAARAQRVSDIPTRDSEVTRLEGEIRKLKEQDLPALLNQGLQQAVNDIETQLNQGIQQAVARIEGNLAGRFEALQTQIVGDLRRFAERIDGIEKRLPT